MTDEQEPLFPLTGKYFGANPEPTEYAAGAEIEVKDRGPLKPGRVGHLVLRAYSRVTVTTAYQASWLATGDYHKHRRETTRLKTRGFVEEHGTLPNPAPGGRTVKAYQITGAGRVDLARLDRLEDK